MGIELRFADLPFLEIHNRLSLVGTNAFGVHKLICRFDVNVAAQTVESSLSLLSLFARVDVQERDLGWLVPDTRTPLSTATEARTLPLQLAIRLSTEQLEALTRDNPEGLTSTRIAFVGIASGPTGVREISGLGHCAINRDEWITALEQCGFADALNIWLQIPRNGGEALRDATHALKEAQAHHLAGRFADAVGRCRVAVEKVNGSAKGFNFNNREINSLEDRVALLQSAISKLTSEPHHGLGKDYGASESRLALAVTAAIVEYFAA